MNDQDRPCPAGCGRTARVGHLLCPQCWATVPFRLKVEVRHAWRQWQGDYGDTERMRAYRMARTNAIESVP